MAVEVEIKLKISDPEHLTEKLKALGFQAGETMLESDTYFTSEHHDFVKLGEALRVRKVRDLETGTETAAITYKGKKLDNCSMAREELEMQISDAGTGEMLLERIGFHAVPILEKTRKYLYRNEMTACVDQVRGLGDYLELEIIVDTEPEREGALQKINTVLKKLGYSMADTTRCSYLSMLTKEKNKMTKAELQERFEFRNVKAEEADQTIAIENICFPPNEACSPKSMVERAAQASDTFLVAVDRQTGKIAGFLNGIATDEEVFRDEFFTDIRLNDQKGKNIMLLGLDVLPEYRGQGLAREIMERYLSREREKGRKKVILTCLDEKVKMYQKMGYLDLGLSGSVWGGEQWHDMMYEL